MREHCKKDGTRPRQSDDRAAEGAGQARTALAQLLDKAKAKFSDRRYAAAHDKSKELAAVSRLNNEAIKRSRAAQRYSWQGKNDVKK